jgi:hypothetical protein
MCHAGGHGGDSSVAQWPVEPVGGIRRWLELELEGVPSALQIA